MNNEAYVYAILVSGKARYVGKGRGLRAQKHFSYAKQLLRRRAAGEKIKATRFYNELAVAIDRGLSIGIRILAEGLSDEAAYQLELTEIARLRPQLWNARDGGPGMTSSAAKTLWADPVYKALQKNIGQPARLAALWADPDFVKRQSAAASARLKSLLADPSRAKPIRDGARKKWEDAEYRAWKSAHNSQIAVANNARPEKKAQQSQLIARLNSDPAFNEKRLTALRAAFAARKLRKAEAQKASNG